MAISIFLSPSSMEKRAGLYREFAFHIVQVLQGYGLWEGDVTYEIWRGEAHEQLGGKKVGIGSGIPTEREILQRINLDTITEEPKGFSLLFKGTCPKFAPDGTVEVCCSNLTRKIYGDICVEFSPFTSSREDFIQIFSDLENDLHENLLEHSGCRKIYASLDLDVVYDISDGIYLGYDRIHTFFEDLYTLMVKRLKPEESYLNQRSHKPTLTSAITSIQDTLAPFQDNFIISGLEDATKFQQGLKKFLSEINVAATTASFILFDKNPQDNFLKKAIDEIIFTLAPALNRLYGKKDDQQQKLTKAIDELSLSIKKRDVLDSLKKV